MPSSTAIEEVRGGLIVISSRLSDVTEVQTNSIPALGDASVGEPV